MVVMATRLLINRSNMFLCIGPISSGKTLLLKRLQNVEVDETTSSIPTIGTNLFQIQIDSYILEIRELGGTIAPLWPKYLSRASKIIYVVDASDLCQISCAGVMLYSILGNSTCRNSKIMLVLAKMDVSYRQMRNEALLMLQIDRLRKEIPQPITIIETSALTGEGIDKIIEWFKTDLPKALTYGL